MQTIALSLGLWALVSPTQQTVQLIGGTEVTPTDVRMGDPVATSTVGVMSVEGACTGTLIAPDTVITAGHCAQADDMSVVFNLNIYESAALTVPVTKRIIHPDFNAPGLPYHAHDLALLHFDVSLPAGYAPLALHESMEAIADGTMVTVAGFGVTTTAEVSDVPGSGGDGPLREAQVKISNYDFATAQFTVDQSKGHGACAGDSGGPAILATANGPELLGVTHGGDACDDYGIYTKVPMHAKWIHHAIDLLRQAARLYP